MNSSRQTCVLGALCLVSIGAPSPGAEVSAARSPQLDAIHLHDAAGARIRRELDGRISRLYGAPLAHGPSAWGSAEACRQRTSAFFNVPPAEIVLGGLHADGRRELPLMLDRATGTYKFTAVYYHQVKGGLPVEGSGLIVLVRNEPAFPVVLASANLFDLRDFVVTDQALGATADRALANARLAVGKNCSFSRPVQVIWSGTDAQLAQPAVAWRFEAERGQWGTASHESWLLVADALSGRILHQESLIVHADVAGTVQGLATERFTAEICAAESSTPLPYARVSHGASVVYADAQGQFIMPTCCTTAAQLEASLRGRFFKIVNFGAPDSVLSLSVTPPGPAQFLFNPLNEEFPRAEVNAYLQCNLARDYILDHVPNFPQVATQQEYEVRVNLSGECDAAWGGPAGGFIVFPRASLPGSPNDCPNMANSTLVHHEYGHHVAFAGSGTGSGTYGEGMADTVAVLVTDQPEMSLGHFGDCRESIRSAINNRQFPCCCEPHSCGQIISGSVWDTRSELLRTNPSTYRQIISELIFSSIMLHLGQSVTPSITIDVLTLDDDNAFLDDGTPHYNEIATGFGNHNMDAPPLVYLDYSFPDGQPDFVSPDGGSTVKIQFTPVIDSLSPVPGAVQFFVDVGQGFAPASVTQVGSGIFQGVFPPSVCGSTVRYYFAALTAGGLTVLVPASAPTLALEALSSSGSGEVLFADNMESGQGQWLSTWDIPPWSGFWNVVQPLGTVFEGDQAAPSEDTSPAPGVRCWITQQGTGGSADQADVDGGPVHLISPVIDLGGQDALVSCDVWFFSSGAGTSGADFLDISLSDDDGRTWALVRSISGTSGQWRTERFFVGRYVAPTGLVRVRFSTSDDADGVGESIVEAGVDEVRVLRFECPPLDPADLNQDGVVSGLDLAMLLAAWGACPGGASPCPADLNHSGGVNGLDLAMLLAAWG